MSFGVRSGPLSAARHRGQLVQVALTGVIPEPRIPCAVEGSNAGTALAVTGQHARSRTVSGSGKGGQR